MTNGDKREFAQCFNRMAVATRLSPAEADAAMQRVYWDGLEDLPLDAVKQAAVTLARRAQWFPKLAEWRAATELERHSRALAAATSDLQTDWNHECSICNDTGWVPCTCIPGRKCDRARAHASHTYSVCCTCRSSNRSYQRKQLEQRVRGGFSGGERGGR